MKTYATAFSSDCDIMERIDATGINRYEVTSNKVGNVEAERPILDIVLNLTAISEYCKALAKAYKHIEEDGVSDKYFKKAKLIKEENPEVSEYLSLIDKLPIATVAKIKPEAIARHLEETLKFYY